MKKEKERIAKVMAHAGLCSRREAERFIQEGKVFVNGKRLDTPAFLVSVEDKITLENKQMPLPDKTRLFCYYKPVGLMTTHKDPEGRKTVFDSLPKNLPRLISVGRLDLNSEGLLLLTNDGELSRFLELPKRGWKRHYKVRVFGKLKEGIKEELEKGVTVEGIHYAPIEFDIDSVNGANTWVNVTLTEGKNREIRRVMKYFGLEVSRLIRLSYGPFQLGNLKRGEIKEIPYKVIKEQIPCV
ncbi:MAG: rRNA pseudouridine synthase [Alphaproteobacteria bacterium]|nr:pseudouridine synthase [Alphaproteobacteria bacterium]NCB49711.1 rRNA pseudouridine synthase [Alphaproteobacteria bacterium]